MNHGEYWFRSSHNNLMDSNFVFYSALCFHYFVMHQYIIVKVYYVVVNLTKILKNGTEKKATFYTNFFVNIKAFSTLFCYHSLKSRGFFAYRNDICLRLDNVFLSLGFFNICWKLSLYNIFTVKTDSILPSPKDFASN